MPCNIPDCVEEYLRIIEAGEQRTNKETKAFASLVRRIFQTEDIHVKTERLAQYLSLEKYWSYRWLPWERAIIALWLCTYRADNTPRFKTLFCMLGRGAGKDGMIGITAFLLVSPYNPVPRYNADICANNEEQAVTPCHDLNDILENPQNEAKLQRHFYHTKELIQGRKNRGIIKGRTNNPKGRDGMRSGIVIFNEVHQFENYDNIKVFVSGQGKVADPRVGLFSSNGDVTDGVLDDYLKRGREILFSDAPDDGFLPLIYCLDSEDEVHEPLNWTKANPSLAYFPHLQREIEDEYRDWKEHPEQNGDFMTKRMGLRVGRKELAVTDYEKIRATNQPLPDLAGKSCTAGIDYAVLSDWAAVNLHFKVGEMRYDINHAWICAKSKDLHRIKAPWQTWVRDGHCTYVDDETIKPSIIADYLVAMGRKYNIKKLSCDNFRWALLADALRMAGWDVDSKDKVKLLRPSDIMNIEPVIQNCFDRRLFCWGDNPCLRWAVNNTKRVPAATKNGGSDTGNFYYAKIEAKSRKTDPFMALVASMAIENELNTSTVVTPSVGVFTF